jgi:hypothetical protein
MLRLLLNNRDILSSDLGERRHTYHNRKSHYFRDISYFHVWALSLGIKQPGREADHPPPSSAEVKG